MTTFLHTRRRATVAATATLALGVALGAGSTAQAASRATGSPVNLKTGAVNDMIASAAKRALGGPATGQLAVSAAAVSAAHRPGRADRPTAGIPGVTRTTPLAPMTSTTLAKPQASTTSAGGSASRTPLTTTAPTCTQLAGDVTPTNDRVWVHWADVGLPSYTILRMREGGAWTQIHVAQAGETSYLDLGVNPRSWFSYRITGNGVDCALNGISMATSDDWGYPDAVWGASSSGQGSGSLAMQDVFSQAMPSTQTGMDPAFSPDGRRMIVANSPDGVSWTMDILRVNPQSGDQRILRVAMPAGSAGAEPAWSPDGRSVVYTRYQIDPTTHQATASQLWRLDAQTGATALVPGSDGLLQADWRSASTFVAAGLTQGSGLYLLPTAGGTATPVAGTANAGDPRRAPNGRIWFTEGDGTNYSIRYISPTAGDPVTTYKSSTTDYYERTRIAPDGTLFVEDVNEDPTSSSYHTFTVLADHFDSAGLQTTTIGASVNGSLSGFNGYDIRQPKSKGTSDFVGSAGSDIIARDSTGTLWAYPSTPSSFAGTRVRIGSGWNVFNTVLAAGDLNGDNRADLLARDAQGNLWRYDGLGGGYFAGRVRVGTGWNGYLMLAPGDFNGDGIADLLSRDPSGNLWLYPGTGLGTLGSRVRVGVGWQVMTAIEAVGDFNLDNHSDLVARDSSGRLWLYPGNGVGGFGSRRQVGSGWNVFNALAGPELLGTNPVVYARLGDGRLLAYVVVGDGHFDGSQVYVVGTGWSSYLITS
ncbi:MAG TPA: FG-GAP-like repeat-containing protein [Pedococcus sp.]|nr:FG-GAP-like repeat-containing protein [Pedococcus sp.]